MAVRVLVVLDGSSSDRSLVEFGILWARRLKVSLRGLGIVDEASLLKPEPVPIGASHFKHQLDERRRFDAQRRVTESLDDLRSRCERADVECSRVEAHGSADQVILREAQRCDLLILSGEAHFGARVQEAPDPALTVVLRRSPRAVLAVPRTLPSLALDRVVVAYDGSPQAARALESFCWLQGPTRPSVDVVSVHRDASTAAERAALAVDYLVDHGFSARPRPVSTTARVDDALLGAVASLEAGLLVMGAYGKPRLREVLIGSTTRSLLRRSPVPLFLHH
jgi:nucleotide-binding universal stress UspA family protein